MVLKMTLHAGTALVAISQVGKLRHSNVMVLAKEPAAVTGPKSGPSAPTLTLSHTHLGT